MNVGHDADAKASVFCGARRQSKEEYKFRQRAFREIGEFEFFFVNRLFHLIREQGKFGLVPSEQVPTPFLTALCVAPPSNNALEGLFSDLKTKVRVHSGICKEHRKQLLDEYIKREYHPKCPGDLARNFAETWNIMCYLTI